MNQVKVTYIYHSGYVCELKNMIFVFDYYKGDLPYFDQSKDLYFFVSHKHEDHFNPEIFKYWTKERPVHYFIGSEVSFSSKYLDRLQVPEQVRPYILTVGKNQKITRKNFSFETYRSTDAGVAFLISAENRKIYHAGDLHWWHWNGEEKSKNHNMEALYKREVMKMKGETIDLAFLVLDPRQEDASSLGMEYFVQTISCKYVLPMHLFEQYHLVKEVKPKIDAYLPDGELLEIKESGQEFVLWNT